jgi:hypothetical protein
MDVCADFGKRRVSEIAPGNRHDIEGSAARPGGEIRIGAAKNLTKPALRPVSHHGRSNPPRCDDAEPIARAIVRPANQRHIARRDPTAALLHDLELSV